MVGMRARPSARLLVVDDDGRVLLFRFAPNDDAGEAFWATPGGELEPGETFAAAAVRELREETGLAVASVGPEVARRQFALPMPGGETAWADERFFLIHTPAFEPARDGWTDLEREVMQDHRWWPPEDLRATNEQVWPETLADLLDGLRGLKRGRRTGKTGA